MTRPAGREERSASRHGRDIDTPKGRVATHPASLMTLPTRPMTRVVTMLALVCARQRAHHGGAPETDEQESLLEDQRFFFFSTRSSM